MKLTDKMMVKLMNWVGNPSDIVIPNIYIGKWEMDIFRLTDAGMIYEYEIKVSRSDFKNDFKKAFSRPVKEDGKYVMVDAVVKGRPIKHWKQEVITKHQSLIDSKRCNKFFFVVPENLISPDECPDPCGLIYFTDYTFIIVKSPRLIHKEKMDTSKYKSLAKKLAFRELQLRQKLHYINSKL